MDVQALANRVRSEFIEMPGLKLTLSQASRLWGLDRATCQQIIDALVESAFLRCTVGGTIVRAAD